jgi:phosphoglycolate phosphatase
MMTLPKPHAILFDWDNTLVDTWPTIHAALNMTMRHMQHAEWSLEQVKGNVKKSMRDAFPELFGDRWQEAATHYQQSYRSLHLQQLKPLPHAEQTLALLRNYPVFVGLVSNKKGDTLRLEAAHLGWEKYFDVAIGAGDAARDKPSADPALLALTNYVGARAESVWFVGDTGVDLECAQAIGATAVLFGDHAPEGMMHDGFGFAAHALDHTAFAQLFLAAIGAGSPAHAHG